MADFMTQYHLDTIARAHKPRGGGLGVLLLIALGLVVYLLVSCTHIPGITNLAKGSFPPVRKYPTVFHPAVVNLQI